tara:strand:- start:310 stop:1338 length:1029 start_codon:yes stop_codon:yes gene_type:complete
MGFPSSSTLMPFFEQYLGKTPGTEYNTFGVIAAAAPSAVVGVDAMIKSNQAKKQLKTQQGYVDTLMQSYMSKPIYNPYKNMSVATKAAQMKVEETDKALANTLDTLRATGTSAGGATALAQAALQSKLGIAADIEKQEVNNQQLEAKGEFMVQQAELGRMGEQMDYEQSKADQLRVEQFGYGERAADMAGALGALGLEASRGLSTGKDTNKKITQTGDFNVPVDGGLPPLINPGDDPFSQIALPDTTAPMSPNDIATQRTRQELQRRDLETEPEKISLDAESEALEDANLVIEDVGSSGVEDLINSPEWTSLDDVDKVLKIRNSPAGKTLTVDQIYKIAGIK